MKILYYNYSFCERIGGGTHAREVLAALKGLPNVEVMPWPVVDSRATYAPGSAPVREKLRWLPKSFRGWVRFWVKPLKKELEELLACHPSQYDVILFRPNALLRMVPLIKRAFPAIHLCVEINALVHSEGMHGVWFRMFWLRREAALINRADSIMVVSEYLKNQLTGLGVPAEKILANPNGVNLERFGEAARQERSSTRRKLHLPDDAFVLGYVGGMESFRRLPFMLHQLVEFMTKNENIHLIMAGDGQDRPEIDRILAAIPDEVRDRICFDGSVPYEEVPELMSAFDCALFPYSNPYGSPQKLFEYMAMGLPVIGPDVPVVREVFDAHVHLLLADQSGKDFLPLLTEMHQNCAKRGSLSVEGCQWVTEHYTWQKNAERLVAFIHQWILEGGR